MASRLLELCPLIGIRKDQVGDQAVVERALRNVLAANGQDLAGRLDIADD